MECYRGDAAVGTVNDDPAVAVGLVDLLQAQAELRPDLRERLESASANLDAAARHIEQLQSVVRVVVKETPAGQSLDLERSQTSVQPSGVSFQRGTPG